MTLKNRWLLKLDKQDADAFRGLPAKTGCTCLISNLMLSVYAAGVNIPASESVEFVRKISPLTYKFLVRVTDGEERAIKNLTRLMRAETITDCLRRAIRYQDSILPR